MRRRVEATHLLRIAMGRGVPAIVLAAGESSRLGQPKALVEVDGIPLAAHAVRRLIEGGADPIWIVTRQDLAVDLALRCPEANVVVNPNPDAGRTGSIQHGIMSVIREQGCPPEKLLIAPVDRIGFESSTVARVLQETGTCHPVPAGHPVLLDAMDCAQVLTSSPDAPLRDIIDSQPIVAPGRHLNIDHPSDLEALE